MLSSFVISSTVLHLFKIFPPLLLFQHCTYNNKAAIEQQCILNLICKLVQNTNWHCCSSHFSFIQHVCPVVRCLMISETIANWCGHLICMTFKTDLLIYLYLIRYEPGQTSSSTSRGGWCSRENMKMLFSVDPIKINLYAFGFENCVYGCQHDFAHMHFLSLISNLHFK